MSKHELAIADRWFEKRGDIIILIARLLPVIRTFIAFPAGVARMNRVKFHVYTFVGSFPWCLGLAYVGQKLGKELMSEDSPLKHVTHKLDAVLAVVIVVAAIWFVRSRLRAFKRTGTPMRRRPRSRPRPPPSRSPDPSLTSLVRLPCSPRAGCPNAIAV